MSLSALVVDGRRGGASHCSSIMEGLVIAFETRSVNSLLVVDVLRFEILECAHGIDLFA
jgi:hypothetical protein